ncbi:hypothetical protein MP638_000888 [Amoeboaphelidium occidentale]|nr:hypothetical protein MP638_000888 [Amoeboaphelidium occidentale]
MEEDDLNLPRATVYKLIDEMKPDDIVYAKETKDLLMDACVEFVHLIATESNAVCEKTTKKTISAEHVMQAVKNLGFEEYIDDLKAAFEDHKKELKDRDTKRTNASKFGNSGLTEEELLKQQEELFNQARQKMMGSGPQ